MLSMLVSGLIELIISPAISSLIISAMTYTTLFFDLDDTIYPSSNGLWGAIRQRMEEYMQEKLHIPSHQVHSLQRFYYDQYGTTWRGLQHDYQVDPNDFLIYVHDLPLEQYLKPEPELKQLLLSLPESKWVFTNANHQHAQRVIDMIQISDCFDGIIDVYALGLHCKPDPIAYQLALQLAGESVPARSVLFDDVYRNLIPANELGLTTVLVGSEENFPGVHVSVKSLFDLSNAFPALWTG